MKKKDIVNSISEKTGIDKNTVITTINSLISEITEVLGNGGSVYIRFFGTFSPKKRAAKPARNIKKNTTIFIPERYIPYFKPSDYFKNDVIEGMKKIKQSTDNQLKS
ncbi:MAG: integration host factor subunit beta [Bacteroidales bacterium OttesenSCG-928-I14]|jgi:DNA-binding protein HU-beta|nr:integration host factor subunit beta [Bacteroidales bacterium OttesenSCG-928-I14]